MNRITERLAHRKAWLAPMAGITDEIFRVLCLEQGCGMTCTEMVSAKGLHFGGGHSEELLRISDTEGCAAVQLFGSDAAIIAEQIAQLCTADTEQRIAWLDINMGCPAPKITRNGEGSALMMTPELAQRIMAAAVRTADRPVTVKFRKGWDDAHVNAVDFARRMEDAGAAALAIHGRTREQFYSGRADRAIIRAVKEAVSIPVIGNGDIFCAQDALDLLSETGVDGIMVARGAQGNPWIFAQIEAFWQRGEKLSPPSIFERIDMALRHTRERVAAHGKRAVPEMRKHLAWYIEGCFGAAAIRGRINTCHSYGDVEKVLYAYRDQLIERENASGGQLS